MMVDVGSLVCTWSSGPSTVQVPVRVSMVRKRYPTQTVVESLSLQNSERYCNAMKPPGAVDIGSACHMIAL